MRRVRAALVLVALGVSGCSYQEMLEKYAPPEAVELSRATLERVRTGRIVEVEESFDPEYVDAAMPEKLQAISRLFPPGEPKAVVLIGANLGRMPSRSLTTLTFELEFEQGWLAAAIACQQTDGGPLRVSGIHVQPMGASLQALHAFTLAGRTPTHYLVLFASVGVALFIAATLVACAREKGLRRKWLWVLFVALGVGGVVLDWSSGQVGFRPVSVHLLGAGAQRASPYAPWFLTASFPLGAVVYLVRRLRRRSASPPPSETVSA